MLSPLSPLNDLIRDESKRKITWSSQTEIAFEATKQILTSAPVLTQADFSLPFKIYTDASLVAGAGILTQIQDGIERVIGVRFTVITDHASLRWLLFLKEPHGKLGRWAVRLQAFDFEFVHRPGKKIGAPDALSRAVEMIHIDSELKTDDKWYNVFAHDPHDVFRARVRTYHVNYYLKK